MGDCGQAELGGQGLGQRWAGGRVGQWRKGVWWWWWRGSKAEVDSGGQSPPRLPLLS